MQLNERDIDILRAVARYRFLSSSQTIKLAGGSPQGVLRRLRLLYDHGYLDRPRAQLAQLFTLGNHPFVYGLGRNGARLLAACSGAPLNKLDWTTKNARADAMFIAHTLETAEVMIAFELACRSQSATQLIDQQELLRFMPETTRSSRNPFAWRADATVGTQPTSIGLTPDRLFSFAFPNNTRLNFALELDRGTMPVKRRSLKGTSFARKVLAYWEGWKARQHKERWGFRQFRVLTVTSSLPWGHGD